MKVNPIVRIGIGISLAIFALIWGLAFLKGKNVFSSEKTFYAEYPKVDGLVASSPVIMNGLKVGSIRDIVFKDEGLGSLLVVFSVAEQYNVPVGSIANIGSIDLMGTKALQIQRVASATYHQTGDTLRSAIEQDIADAVNKQIIPLKNKAEKLMSSLDTVLIVFQEVFNDRTKVDLQKGISSLSRSMNSVEHILASADKAMSAQDRLSKIMANAESITGNLAKNNEKIERLLTNFANISDSLSGTSIADIVLNAKNTLASLDEITARINKGEGSMGALLNNDTLYQNLESASKNLDFLLVDIQQNPKRYIHFSLFDRSKNYELDKEAIDKFYEMQRAKQAPAEVKK